jgi:hypothetical protein
VTRPIEPTTALIQRWLFGISPTSGLAIPLPASRLDVFPVGVNPTAESCERLIERPAQVGQLVEPGGRRRDAAHPSSPSGERLGAGRCVEFVENEEVVIDALGHHAPQDFRQSLPILGGWYVPGGSDVWVWRISSMDSPTLCAARIMATRQGVSAKNRRRLPLVRSLGRSPWSSYQRTAERAIPDRSSYRTASRQLLSRNRECRALRHNVEPCARRCLRDELAMPTVNLVRVNCEHSRRKSDGETCLHPSMASRRAPVSDATSD